MTFDPYRDDPHRNAVPPPDPARDYGSQQRAGAGAAILLGALLLAAIGGFIYFFAGIGDRSAATTDIRPPITQPATTGAAPAPEITGSSANMPPATEPTAEPKAKPVE
jgi:hypothetical protein